MKEYHKIETLFNRDEKTKKLIQGSYRNETFEYLNYDKLSNFTHNKTISKIRDSFRVSAEDKELVKRLVRK